MEGYELAFTDDFDGPELDRRLWLPWYLPQWSSRERAAARYALADGCLVLRIDVDQPPWCEPLDGRTRVSSLQTGCFAGPVGSRVGQHRFHPDLVVREAQPEKRLYTPRYCHVEVRARVSAHPTTMAALWMIGFEDAPERSGEICVFEVFGRDVQPGVVRVGMGVHPFGDPALVDDFAQVPLPMDATAFHVYAATWTPTEVVFAVDGQHVRTVAQSPSYPMQLMLGLYDFPPEPGVPAEPSPHPKELVVDWVRAWRPAR